MASVEVSCIIADAPYTRRFSFGIDKKILYPVSEYPYIKAVFDAVGKRDSHTIAVKEAAPQEEKR